MPTLPFLNSTLAFSPSPPQLPLDIRTNDASRLGSLALSAVTASLAAATLFITYLHLRLQKRRVNGTPSSEEGDEGVDGEGEAVVLEDISGAPDKSSHIEGEWTAELERGLDGDEV